MSGDDIDAFGAVDFDGHDAFGAVDTQDGSAVSERSDVEESKVDSKPPANVVEVLDEFGRAVPPSVTRSPPRLRSPDAPSTAAVDAANAFLADTRHRSRSRSPRRRTMYSSPPRGDRFIRDSYGGPIGRDRDFPPIDVRFDSRDFRDRRDVRDAPHYGGFRGGGDRPPRPVPFRSSKPDPLNNVLLIMCLGPTQGPYAEYIAEVAKRAGVESTIRVLNGNLGSAIEEAYSEGFGAVAIVGRENEKSLTVSFKFLDPEHAYDPSGNPRMSVESPLDDVLRRMLLRPKIVVSRDVAFDRPPIRCTATIPYVPGRFPPYRPASAAGPTAAGAAAAAAVAAAAAAKGLIDPKVAEAAQKQAADLKLREQIVVQLVDKKELDQRALEAQQQASMLAARRKAEAAAAAAAARQQQVQAAYAAQYGAAYMDPSLHGTGYYPAAAGTATAADPYYQAAGHAAASTAAVAQTAAYPPGYGADAARHYGSSASASTPAQSQPYPAPVPAATSTAGTAPTSGYGAAAQYPSAAALPANSAPQSSYYQSAQSHPPPAAAATGQAYGVTPSATPALTQGSAAYGGYQQQGYSGYGYQQPQTQSQSQLQLQPQQQRGPPIANTQYPYATYGSFGASPAVSSSSASAFPAAASSSPYGTPASANSYGGTAIPAASGQQQQQQAPKQATSIAEYHQQLAEYQKQLQQYQAYQASLQRQQS